MLDEGAFCSTTTPATVTVNNPSSWWQVKEGDVVSDGAISSSIPPTAYESTLMVYDVDEFPGIPSAGAGIAVGSGSVSTPQPPFGWQAENSFYSAPIPDYAFFEGRISSGLGVIYEPPSSPFDIDDVGNGTLDSKGYYWIKYTGDLQIDNPDSESIGNKKAIIFVDGNLTINGPINVTPGQGFFMAIVSGNITVNGGVGDPAVLSPSPDLEGIYITDGQFQTGLSAEQLYVRGSVVGAGGISLERNLSDNSLYPGELFEFAVDQLMAYPADLTPSRLIWREVAP
jgi:hypothetical protein